MGSLSFAAQTSTNETGAKDVKEKVTEAVQAIEKYSVDQRDEAVKKGKAVLDDLDAPSTAWNPNSIRNGARWISPLARKQGLA
jgi:hypothetical protein